MIAALALTTASASLIAVAFPFIFLVIALWLRKRFANNSPLLGSTAHVNSALTPNGTVIVQGQLWPARSIDGAGIAVRQSVRIVGVKNLRLLVETE